MPPRIISSPGGTALGGQGLPLAPTKPPPYPQHSGQNGQCTISRVHCSLQCLAHHPTLPFKSRSFQTQPSDTSPSCGLFRLPHPPGWKHLEHLGLVTSGHSTLAFSKSEVLVDRPPLLFQQLCWLPEIGGPI